MYPAAAGRELVRFWRDFMVEAPDEVGSGLAFICAPPVEFVPKRVRGQPVIGVVVCYCGDVDRRRRSSPRSSNSDLPPWAWSSPCRTWPSNSSSIPQPRRGPQLLDGGLLRGPPQRSRPHPFRKATQPVSPMTQIILIAGGGAIARVDDATWRSVTTDSVEHPLPVDVGRSGGHRAEHQLHQGVGGAMKPWNTGRVYLNFLGDEGKDRVEAGFGPEKYRVFGV